MIRREDHPLTRHVRARLDERRADVLRAFTNPALWENVRPDETPDLLIACLSLNPPDAEAKLKAAHDLLAQGGLFLGASFGAETLGSVRDVLIEAECLICGGAARRLSTLSDVATWGQMMLEAGFALPVIDVEMIEIDEGDLFKLLASARLFRSARPSPLHPAPRPFWRTARDLWAKKNGGPKAAVQIVYLHGWKESPPKRV